MNEELYNMKEWNANFIEKRTDSIAEKLIAMYPYLRSKQNYENIIDREIFIESMGLKAKGYLNVDESVIIYAGSEINPNAEEILSDDLEDFRTDLQRKKIIKINKGRRYLTEDLNVTSVSKAAKFILGGCKNGWDVWKDTNGIKINDSLRLKHDENLSIDLFDFI